VVDAGLLREWREGLRGLLDLLLPTHCPGCGRGGLAQGSWLCGSCRLHLQVIEGFLCARCGAPRLSPAAACSVDHRRFQGLGWVRSAYLYAGAGGALLRRLKFSADFAGLVPLSATMARLMQQAMLGLRSRRALVVFVPLHASRRRRRGFDQARLLAEGVARASGLECQSVLRRRFATPPHGFLSDADRAQNVRAAFHLHSAARLPGRDVVLVDDVVTTGATARACAAALLAGGARSVALLTACRGRLESTTGARPTRTG
jgi:ComF family protein